jgi:predicted flap endonuclease-1-like 5' DNA nuclease
MAHGAAASEGCPECSASGYDEHDPDESCSRCNGTGEYTGIPDAWGEYGVDAVYLAVDDSNESESRQLVRVDTYSCETALTLEAAEELASRLYRVAREARGEAENSALAIALAAGQRRLTSIRDELGPRAFNCLARSGVMTVEQAAGMSDEELLRIVNLGVGTLERIRGVVGRDYRPQGV